MCTVFQIKLRSKSFFNLSTFKNSYFFPCKAFSLGAQMPNRPIRPVIHLVLERGRKDQKEGDHPISDDKLRT